MNSQAVPREHLVRLAGRLQQQGLTGLELLDVSYSSVVPHDDILDDSLPSSLAAAALQYCPNLAHLIVEDSRWDYDRPRRFELSTVAQALRLRDVNGKARLLHTLHLQYEEEFSESEYLTHGKLTLIPIYLQNRRRGNRLSHKNLLRVSISPCPIRGADLTGSVRGTTFP